MQRRAFVQFALATPLAWRVGAATAGTPERAFEDPARDYLSRMRTPDCDYPGDVRADGRTRAVLASLHGRLERAERIIGYANFSVISLDDLVAYSRNYPDIGALPLSEAALIEELFYADASRYGFLGRKPLDKLTQRIDLFGLGLDYAMYHKSFWGVHDEDSLSPWFRLGGIFVSVPAAIAWAGNRVDVFGLGTDHAMFTKTRTGSSWTSEWQRLGGAFTSAASLVSRGPNQLDIFARGALSAARWLAGRSPARYAMADMIDKLI